MAQAPVLNALYSKVASDPGLKNKIKFVGAAQGQDQTAAQGWKKINKVPFAIVPDTDRKLSKAMNFGPYPVTMLVDKSGRVVWVEVGEMQGSELSKAFSGIKSAVK
jgi:hypothetical protein